MNKDDTLLLFGRSMFIDKIREYIPFLIDKYPSMGVDLKLQKITIEELLNGN